MPESTLAVRKTRGPVPWQLVLLHPPCPPRPDRPEEPVPLSDFAFRTKREAQQWLARLEALRAPWHLPVDEWPADLRVRAACIREQTPMAQEVARVGLRAPGGGR